jgi:hypothetical protein
MYVNFTKCIYQFHSLPSPKNTMLILLVVCRPGFSSPGVPPGPVLVQLRVEAASRTSSALASAAAKAGFRSNFRLNLR